MAKNLFYASFPLHSFNLYGVAIVQQIKNLIILTIKTRLMCVYILTIKTQLLFVCVYIYIYIYIYICNELIEETARRRKLIFGM